MAKRGSMPRTRKQLEGITPRRAPKVRTNADNLRGSTRWQRFRAWFRARHPVCADPLGLHDLTGEPTDVADRRDLHVHHIVPVNEDPTTAFVEANCAALCVQCHNEIEAMERRGDETRTLFARNEAVSK